MIENVLTLDRARAAAKKIADERGDTQYRKGGHSCFYAPLPEILDADDVKNLKERFPLLDVPLTSGCMIGELLKDEGLLTDAIKHDFGMVGFLVEQSYLSVDSDETTRYLEVMQHAQDHGSTWQEAYNQAESAL
jgi:hypothetical protein